MTPDTPQTGTRAGFVAVIGAPNAGKSTLVNRLTGSKVSIVTQKVQTTRFTVRGIVDTANEAGVSQLLSAFFGFMYLEMDDVRATINPDVRPNTMAIDFPEGMVLNESLVQEMAQELSELTAGGDWTQSRTTFEMLETYTVISQILADFIVVMGLGALLIGGVGIMNTMIVMVRRRTTEIASVKTFGLKARQVAAMFAEAGGTVMQFGKPHPPIYRLARERVAALAPGAKRILAIGDGLPTDITGTYVFDQRDRDFHFRPGPIMSQFPSEPLVPRTSMMTWAYPRETQNSVMPASFWPMGTSVSWRPFV